MSTFLLGIIEGFYGHSWSWHERREQAEFLADAGMNTYVYAPKSDPWLRRRWRERWPDEHRAELRALREVCAERAVAFGIGLSPLSIYRNYDAPARVALQQKVAAINELQPDLLCLLFDDMPGDVAGLASLQAGICHDVAAASEARRLIMCPTYYSYDPVLEKVFGPRPPAYFSDLGEALDATVDVFWTGPEVCSPRYDSRHLLEIGSMLRRLPVLWDNYPVNDGRLTSRYLHLEPFSGRGGIAPSLRGHLANPMNQPTLSRIPLLSLVDVYREPNGRVKSLGAYAGSVCSAGLAAAIAEHRQMFQHTGLDGLTGDQRQVLLDVYCRFDEPCAREICAWLRGEYRFDPDCLTE